jgi:hypothetical protein
VAAKARKASASMRSTRYRGPHEPSDVKKGTAATPGSGLVRPDSSSLTAVTAPITPGSDARVKGSAVVEHREMSFLVLNPTPLVAACSVEGRNGPNESGMVTVLLPSGRGLAASSCRRARRRRGTTKARACETFPRREPAATRRPGARGCLEVGGACGPGGRTRHRDRD